MNLQIAMIISVFGLFITMPIFVRYFAYTDLSTWLKSTGFILCLLVAILPFFASRDLAKLYGNAFPFIEHTLYFIYTFAIILFTLTFIRDALWFVLGIFKWAPNPFHAAILTKANLITVCVALCCSFWSLYEGLKVPDEKHIHLNSPKLTQNRTIVILSDLHISRTVSPHKIQSIIAKVNTLKPDLILLAGDMLDDDIEAIRPTIQLLSQLKASQGTYFVSGNHEFYIGYQAAMHTLENTGLLSLENKKIALAPDFYLAGVADIPTAQRFHGKSQVQQVLSDIPASAYTLFVSHSPTPLALPFDLQISGHTHGGQILPFHLLSWLGNHHLLAGYYPNEKIYVSRGSGQWGPQMRFLAPAEITVLHLAPTSKVISQ